MAADQVFPACCGAEIILHFEKFWPRIAKLGGLSADITPRMLRHLFTLLAGDLG
jgi:hypothetical protein